MKKIFLLSSMILGASSLMAQNYKGHVQDSEGKPLPFANVVLRSLPDSAFICGTVSDIDGNFEVECGQKAGLVAISSVGFETLYMNNPAQDLGTVLLSPSDTQIDEVLVKAQKPKTKLTGNSMVTSIQGSVLAESGNAKEMLAKVPGLTSTSDGIEVIGKGAPVYYINGRKMQDLDELKRINSKDIKEVEVIQNPGAEYDATVSAVVRIKTVRMEGTGFGFDAEVSDNHVVEYNKANPSANLNLRYRHNSLDLFGMVNYWSWTSVNGSLPNQDSYFKDSDGQICRINQVSDFLNTWNGNGLNYNLGFNYQIGDNHFLGARVEGHSSFESGAVFTQETYARKYILGASEPLYEEYSISNQDDNDDPAYNWDANLYYNGTIGKLSVDYNMDLLTKKNDELNTIRENNNGSDSKMIAKTPSSTKMLAQKLVLSYPAWKGSVKAGTEMSFVSRKQGYSITGAGLPATSSDVDEKNMAAFLEYAIQLQKFGSFSAGLRMEHVGFRYNNLISPAESMERFTNDVFPTFSWAGQFGSFQASASYSLKTNRPSYWQLSETVNYINPYSMEGGDPKLKNERNQKLDINMRYKVATLFFGFSNDRDVITQWSYIYNDKGAILMKAINMDEPVRHWQLGINASPTFGIFNANWTAGIMRYNYRQNLADPREATGEREVSLGKPISFFNINNAFKLKHSWLLEVIWNATSKGDWQNFSITNFSSAVNFAVQKSFLKNDALCLRLTVQDAFRTFDQNVELDCGYYKLCQNQHSNQQRINISLRYTFNAQQSKYKGTGAGDDVKSRMDK